MNEQLVEIENQIWASLQQGETLGHPFRTPVVVTQADRPAGRTVILRRANSSRRELVFHTDVRSLKVGHLEKNNDIQWVFYHPQWQQQLLVSGHAHLLLEGEEHQEMWRKTPLFSRRHYLTLFPPGTEIDQPTPEFMMQSETAAESERGIKNFAIVQTHVTEIDWLQLSTDGNRRARFTYDHGNISATWLVP